MRVRILRNTALETLRASIRENLPHYRHGDFSFLETDTTQYRELPIDTDDSGLAQLKMPTPEDAFEVDNCLAVHEYLRSLTPYDARDERLWCYFTHTVFLQYARARWPIPDDDDEAVRAIQAHFFARTNRQVERDNAVSRLWWMAHLCGRVDGVQQEDALKAILYRQDVRANIIERPTVAQSTGVFSVIIKALVQSLSGGKALFERKAFRKVMIELNSIGGFRLLDALPEPELKGILMEVVGTRAGIGSL